MNFDVNKRLGLLLLMAILSFLIVNLNGCSRSIVLLEGSKLEKVDESTRLSPSDIGHTWLIDDSRLAELLECCEETYN
jgi:hypothetical protein